MQLNKLLSKVKCQYEKRTPGRPIDGKGKSNSISSASPLTEMPLFRPHNQQVNEGTEKKLAVLGITWKWNLQSVSLL